MPLEPRISRRVQWAEANAARERRAAVVVVAENMLRKLRRVGASRTTMLEMSVEP
jgi:hypothetical protein